MADLAAPRPRCLIVSLPGGDFALPAAQVLAVQEWLEPYPLPRAAPWVLGWLPREGVAVPVVRPPGLCLPPGETPVQVLLDGGESLFYLPASAIRSPRTPGGTAGEPSPNEGDACAVEGDGRPEPLDAVLLYRSLCVGYNSSSEG